MKENYLSVVISISILMCAKLAQGKYLCALDPDHLWVCR